MKSNGEMKEMILDTITDLVYDFLYFDRKEDEELQLNDIEDSIKSGLITIDEMVERFREELKYRFEDDEQNYKGE